MKILIICSTAFGGGAENSMQTLHSELRLRGIPSNFLSLNKALPIDKTVKLTEGQICFEREWNSGLKSLVSLIRKFNYLVKSQNPSHLIVNCELAELVVALASTRGVRIYCVEHTTQPWIRKRSLGFLVRLILRAKNARWIAVYDTPSDHPLHQRNSKHIPNPISVPTTLADKKQDFKRPKLLFAGRLTSEKRPQWCIEVASDIGLKLEVFGQGPLLEDLKSLALKMRADIVFHGYVANFWEKVELSNSILIAPSEYEGDGMVIAEAIMSGIPVLVSDNPDLRRFKLPENCYAKSIQDFKLKIREIINGNASEYTAKELQRDKMAQTRSIEKICDTWVLELKKS